MLVSFDLDGVLIRNPFRDGVFPEVGEALAPAFGGDARAAVTALVEEHRRRIRMRDDPDGPGGYVRAYDWDDIVATVAARHGAAVPPGSLAERVEHHAGRPGTIGFMHPSVPAALEALRAAGCRLVAATNGLWRYQLPVLKALGIAGLFEVVSAPDLTGAAKPEEAAFRAACGGLAAPQAVHVGDDLLYDVAGARRAGLLAVWVLPSELAREPAVRRAAPWERPALLQRLVAFSKYLQAVLGRRAEADRELLSWALPDAAVLHAGELVPVIARWQGNKPDPGRYRPQPVSLLGAGRALVEWYRAFRRDLPWRRQPPDPYQVMVAEFMLQQTQVRTVLPYFQRFVERFPTVQALAAADEEAVLEVWQGLGYYRRARHLHRAARLIVDRHGGRVPSDPGELRRLPGIGPYMAGAIAAIAHGVPEPAIDGNAARVLSRLLRLWEDPRRPPEREEAAAWVRAMIPPGQAGDFTQALMELGARICRPRPSCTGCPVQRWCSAWACGLTGQLPRPSLRPAAPARPVAVAWVTDARGRLLLVRRGDEGLLGGTWAPPAAELEEGETWQQAARRAALTQAGVEVRVGPRLAELEHAFSHRRWQMRVYAARLLPQAALLAAEEPAGGYAPGPPDGAAPGEGWPEGPLESRWLLPGDTARLPMARAFRRVLEAVSSTAEPLSPAPPRSARRRGFAGTT